MRGTGEEEVRFGSMLLKNNFNPKAMSQLMGHAKEIITIDVYGDTAEIIEDCLEDLQPFIDEVVPQEKEKEEVKSMKKVQNKGSIWPVLLFMYML